MLLFFKKGRMNRTLCFWYFIFNANMIIFFQKILNKFNSKDYTKSMERIYKIKSGHVTTKPLLDKVNCKSTILSRMIDTCLELLEKSSVNL